MVAYSVKALAAGLFSLSLYQRQRHMPADCSLSVVSVLDTQQTYYGMNSVFSLNIRFCLLRSVLPRSPSMLACDP